MQINAKPKRLVDVEALIEVLNKMTVYGVPDKVVDGGQEIMQRAIDTYGVEAQCAVAVEEMSELIKALMKIRRADNPTAKNDVVCSIDAVYNII